MFGLSIILPYFCVLTIAKVMDSNPYAIKYLNMSWRAIHQYNKAFNDTNYWVPVQVLDVSGSSNCTIKVAVARSNCTKLDINKLSKELCKPKQNDGWKICTFEIKQLHWKNSEKTTFLTCFDYIQPPKATQWSRPIENVERNAEDAVTDSVNFLEPLALWDNYLAFIKRFKRMYFSVEEHMKRFKIYKRNLRFAKKLQTEEKGTAVYGETQFSDLTPEEFTKIMLPNLWPPAVSNNDDFDLKKYTFSLNNLPESFDWRKKGVVTPVKNQGSCGSCWAFSVTGNIEGLWAIKTGNLVSLSEQELIDCDTVDKGCNGGLPMNAYREIIRMGGMTTEDSYPYKARNGTCHLVPKDIIVYINDSVHMPRNETVLQAWISQKGPLSVGIDAELLAYYVGGILHPPRKRCPPSMINHGVLIVGYGSENDMPYWTIKNSWGTKWGESGYFRLLRGKDICGVRDLASSAIIY